VNGAEPRSSLSRSPRERVSSGLVIVALDETGQLKSSTATAGVKRQYLGCAGKVANGINTVHLSYVRERTGHALIGARQWIPAEHISDPAKAAAMGLPAGLVFRTKGQLAIDICADAFTDRVRFDFICGDEVYGNCTDRPPHRAGHGRPGGLRRHRSLTARSHRYPGTAAGTARPAGPRRPGDDPADRTRNRPPAQRRDICAPPARPCRALVGVAALPPGPLPLVPPARTTDPRQCPGKLS